MFRSKEEQFDFYWKEIFTGLAYNPIEFNTYRFDQTMSLPGKVNKLYDMFKVLAMNNQEVMDYLKEFVETFDQKLYETIEDVLTVWLEDGRLVDVVRVAISEEVIEARTDYLGKKYDNLKERLDSEKANIVEVTTQLAQSIRYVNYEMFRADGLTDDEIIMQTHEYANEHNIPVINVEGTYNLENALTIPIETSVEWGKTSFIINEQNYLEREYMTDENHFFHIKSKKNPVVLDSFSRGTIRIAYNNKETEIPILEKFNNCYMIIESEFNSDMVGNRLPNTTPLWSKRDFFRIGSEGKLIGDFMWNEFASLTKVTIQEIEEPITINGGNFILNGQSPLNLDDGVYVNSQIKVTRSNVTLKNQTIVIKKGARDNMLNPQWGFILVKDCTNVKLQNVYGTPRYANGIGTYVFRAENVFDLHFDNVTMYGKDSSWSSTGSNYVKDWKIENSKVDVVDVHFMGWNIIASDSTINRFALTGGGLLKLRNIKSRVATSLVDFRKDYGSSWNGVIDIKHINMEVYNHIYSKPNIISWSFAKEFEFKTPLIIAKEISVENVHIEYTDTATPKNMPILSFGTEWDSKGYPNKIHFPKQISIKNITAGGHGEGVHVFNMEGTQNYILKDDGGMIQDEYIPNCIIIIDNVQLPNYRIPTTPDDFLAQFYTNIAQEEVINLTKKSLYPHYQIKNCKNIVVYENVNRKSLYTFENSHINRINAWGSIGVFKDCRVQGNIGAIYTINGMKEYHFFNTTFFPPIINGEVVNTVEALNTHYAFNYNNVERVYGTYVNSRISKGFIKENPINDSFETLLFSSKN